VVDIAFWSWPQWVLIAIVLINTWVALSRLGKSKGIYRLSDILFDVGSLTTLLVCGGFFGQR
jgi:hypothetical protein